MQQAHAASRSSSSQKPSDATGASCSNHHYQQLQQHSSRMLKHMTPTGIDGRLRATVCRSTSFNHTHDARTLYTALAPRAHTPVRQLNASTCTQSAFITRKAQCLPAASGQKPTAAVKTPCFLRHGDEQRTCELIHHPRDKDSFYIRKSYLGVPHRCTVPTTDPCIVAVYLSRSPTVPVCALL